MPNDPDLSAFWSIPDELGPISTSGAAREGRKGRKPVRTSRWRIVPNAQELTQATIRN